MDARRQRVKELFSAAHALSPVERARLFERELALGGATRADIDELLSAHDRAGEFLERGLVGHSTADVETEHDLPLPSAIGGFRVRERLATGGMGVVYLAEQENPRRAVALKVLRRDAASAAARKRFEREARVLARLHHPGIAQIYSAGVEHTDAGAQPWIALEYVPGANVVEHCERERLPLHARLVLVAEACDALEHAHQKGLVHRDLKPSNVLVDEHGRVKVLDFGIAAFAEDEGATFETRTGQLLGTLAYMSPEQARGEDVDLRSDVYALGVLLYELVTGRLPYEVRGLLPHEAARTICEEEPTALARVKPELGRDLGTIVSKALAKEKERRYASAADLGADLRRFLDHRPIAARPTSRVYQLAKLVRRHRGLASGVALAFLVLVLGIIGVSLALDRALDAERSARAERDAQTRLSDERGLEVLTRRAERLWPATAAMVPALDRWLVEADTIVERWPQHVAHFAALDLRTRDRTRPGERPALLDAFDAFTGTNGVLARVRERRARAATLFERSVAAFHHEWSATLEALRDPQCAPRYGGLSIEPQPGLVPLGRDPDSDLFEFAVLDWTGRVPRRDPVTGRLELDEGTAVVLVLLPGGVYTQGFQALSPSYPNYDPRARDFEGPPRATELAPFFLAKYEFTQAQWAGFTGENPSMWEPGSVAWVRPHTGLNPVESIAWDEAAEVMARLRLALPTEAQWEYAAADAGRHTGPRARRIQCSAARTSAARRNTSGRSLECTVCSTPRAATVGSCTRRWGASSQTGTGSTTCSATCGSCAPTPSACTPPRGRRSPARDGCSPIRRITDRDAARASKTRASGCTSDSAATCS
ncbi:MAG: protein kinase [Planctomycetes bacterium]|nr:protein kinase [Planctomycetota bacterium]